MATALYALTRSECEALLQVGTTARLAFVAPDGPHIVPINYVASDHAVVVRTSPSSLLGTHGRGAVVAVELDGFDEAREQGWSVVARGVAQAVVDPSAIRALREGREPRPWVLGPRTLFLRIPWTELSGRRIGSGWSVLGSSAAAQAWLAAVSRLELTERLRLKPSGPRRQPW